MELPFLDNKNGDVFSIIHERDGSYFFVHEIAMALLRFRLFQCLTDLHNSHILSPKLPVEIICLVKLQILADYGLASRKDLLRESNYQRIIQRMEKEIDAHFVEIVEGNRHFLPMLFYPPRNLPPVLTSVVEGEKSEAYAALGTCYEAWSESKYSA